MTGRHHPKLRLRLGRRRPLPFQYTGPAWCGCRFLNGVLMGPCAAHTDLVVPA